MSLIRPLEKLDAWFFVAKNAMVPTNNIKSGLFAHVGHGRNVFISGVDKSYKQGAFGYSATVLEFDCFGYLVLQLQLEPLAAHACHKHMFFFFALDICFDKRDDDKNVK